jgi:hypothetical protein
MHALWRITSPQTRTRFSGSAYGSDHGVDDAEDGGRRANSDRECRDGNRRECSVFAKRPDGVGEILADFIEEHASADVPDTLFDWLDATELRERKPSGLRVREPCAPLFVGRHLDVRAQLVVELAVDAVGVE